LLSLSLNCCRSRSLDSHSLPSHPSSHLSSLHILTRLHRFQDLVACESNCNPHSTHVRTGCVSAQKSWRHRCQRQRSFLTGRCSRWQERKRANVQVDCSSKGLLSCNMPLPVHTLHKKNSQTFASAGCTRVSLRHSWLRCLSGLARNTQCSSVHMLLALFREHSYIVTRS
jgi:hypothetical protein